MRRYILNKISKNPNKIGFSIIFRSQESPAYIYRFIGNTYVVAKLKNLNWSLVKNIEELNWEELTKIKDNLTFIASKDSEFWVNKKRNSPLISIKQNFRKIFNKDTLENKEYWM
jgi:hypothetical protein